MKTAPEVLIVGAGGHAKVVIATLQAAGRTVCAVVDDDTALAGTSILGVRIVGCVDSAKEYRESEAIVAIGDNHTRRAVVDRLGLRWTTAIHPSAVVHPSAKVGPGTVVFAGAVVQPGARIGSHAIMNTAATVDHDCVVGDFVHLAPGTHLGGNVTIGEGSFHGVGAVVLPNLKIGEWSVLGGGAVAVRSVPAGESVIGIPARPLGRVPGRPKVARAPGVATMIGPGDPRWQAVLQRTEHDFYHFPEYVSLCAHYEDIQALAFYAEAGGEVCLIPLLLRKLPPELGTPSAWCDLVSPYGYASPLFSGADRPEHIAGFLEAFRQAADELGVCSVTLRLHPLLGDQLSEAVPLSRVVLHGETVAVDLRETEEEMMRHTRGGHRSDIRRLQKLDFTPVMDDWSYYRDFARIYRQTMSRLGADPYYYFNESYFTALRSALGDSLHLCCVLSPDGSVAAGALFTAVKGILQYHLSGTDERFHQLGPTKLMLHYARQWGKRQGYSVLHLGGGAGAQTDSLFQFKAGFSPLRRPFRTYRMIPNESRYAALTLRLGRDLDPAADLGAVFFPPYRQKAATSCASES
jgi:sugar O-acyltransferase (sialic acid O-acetyltransferase NeuD family)